MDFFRDDPFFSGSRRLETFPDPFENFFGRRPRLAIGGHEPGFGQHLAPFGMMDPFERMNTMMRDMQRMSSSGGPNCHSFTQSTVMSYSHDSRSGEQPKVYQATYSTRTGPGGVTETHKMEKDSVSATQKTSVGHQIGDRSHNVSKKYNYRTKEAEQHQEFVNLDEEDAQKFDEEWQGKTRRMLDGGRPNHQSRRTTLSLPSSETKTRHFEPSSYSKKTGIGHSRVTGQRTDHGSPRYQPYAEGPSHSPNYRHQDRAKRKKGSSRVKFEHEKEFL